jgi:hypothetical protein
MMHLRVDLEQQFRRELDAFEDEQKMPYVTSIERLAKAEGFSEGLAEGLLMPLAGLCGPLPEETEKRVRGLTVAQLQQLGKDLVRFKSLADLDRWLEENVQAEP